MNQEPYRTNYWFWGIASGCIFLALGFVDPVAGATWKGDCSLWSHVGILIRGDYFCSSADIVAPIAFMALFLAVPAALLGWVLQALIVVAWQSSRTTPSHSSSGPKAFETSVIKRLDI
jgi:hypothetical protein